MKTMIGVVVALPGEARAVAGGRLRSYARGGLFSWQPQEKGPVFALICSGPGMQRAGMAARRLVEAGAVCLASLGVSGGLDPQLTAGSLVLARAVFQRSLEGVTRIWEQTAEGMSIETRHWGRGRLDIHFGAVLTAEAPIEKPEDKESLFQMTGALTVDMESAGVACFAMEARVPFLGLRAVSDPASVVVPGKLAACIGPSGRVRSDRLLLAVLQEPRLLKDMVRLQRGFHRGLTSLKHGWQALVRGEIPGLPHLLQVP